MADRVELIKWWDVLDKLERRKRVVRVDSALAMARECQHPDARWLAALFPVGVAVTEDHLREVMLEQGEDVRAMFIASRCGDTRLLRRAAELGYAPAQAVIGMGTDDGEIEFAKKAAAQGNRVALFLMGRSFNHGFEGARDGPKAVAYFKAAAELEHPTAQYFYGELAFGPLNWKRYLLLAGARGRARKQRVRVSDRCVCVCGTFRARLAVSHLAHSGAGGEEAPQRGQAQGVWPPLRRARGAGAAASGCTARGNARESSTGDVLLEHCGATLRSGQGRATEACQDGLGAALGVWREGKQ
jgi:hypothetical protein